MSRYGKHQMKVTLSQRDGLTAELICDHEHVEQCGIPDVFDEDRISALEGYRGEPHIVSEFPIEITGIGEYEFYWRLPKEGDNE